MTVFRGLARLLVPFRWQVALAVLLGVLMVASNVGLLGMAAYLISAAALKPLLVTLTLPMYIVRFAGVARAVSRYAERLTGHSLTFRLLARLRAEVYRRLARLAPAQLLAYRSGDLLARLVADVEELQHLYLGVVGPILVAVLVSALMSGLFALFSPVLAWTALAFLVAAGVGVPLLAGSLGRDVAGRRLSARAELNAQLVDGIQGVQDILAFGQESVFQERIAAQDGVLAHTQRRAAFVSGVEQGLNELVTSLAMWSVLVLAIPLVEHSVVGGVYLAFLAFVMLASFEAVTPLAPALRFLRRTHAAGKRVLDVLDTPPLLNTPPQPPPLASALDVAERRAHSLTFEHVSFAYPGAEDQPALVDVDLVVPDGGQIAIVGPSGAGKSTLARLAARLYDPSGGVVRLDGVDIRSLGPCAVRAAIGVAAQDAHIFSTTVRGNLKIARPDAMDAALEQALEQAQLGDFLRRAPGGLGTWVGEQGQRLSGGERQRLAIARAVLQDAPLLILDEPTANLDTMTERKLLDTLERLMRGRTTVLITHRLSRMERMDEIVVLDRGRIVERGTHERLLASDGLYRRMFDTQNSMLVAGEDTEAGNG